MQQKRHYVYLLKFNITQIVSGPQWKIKTTPKLEYKKQFRDIVKCLQFSDVLDILTDSKKEAMGKLHETARKACLYLFHERRGTLASNQ